MNINKLSNQITKEKNIELLIKLSKELNKENIILESLLNIKQKILNNNTGTNNIIKNENIKDPDKEDEITEEYKNEKKADNTKRPKKNLLHLI